ncbi:DUF1259 domain-containing protein [Streptomyces sp. NPDC048496]|uniref:DUF1259 domain-containing protein n=1 Tax=Streptomyces sp. NPDC048496 TaxID=3365558 RepID=UPI0037161E2B
MCLQDRGRIAAECTAFDRPVRGSCAHRPGRRHTAAIDKAMGVKGTNDGGIYKFTFARKGAVTMHGKVVPPAMGVTTATNFQPTGGGKAAVNGDFAMTADEVQKVTKALRSGGIDIVELHNHALDDNPRHPARPGRRIHRPPDLHSGDPHPCRRADRGGLVGLPVVGGTT